MNLGALYTRNVSKGTHNVQLIDGVADSEYRRDRATTEPRMSPGRFGPLLTAA